MLKFDPYVNFLLINFFLVLHFPKFLAICKFKLLENSKYLFLFLFPYFSHLQTQKIKIFLL